MKLSHREVARFYEDIWCRFDDQAFQELSMAHQARLSAYRSDIVGKVCVDVGCGQGAVSGALARLGAKTVVSVDVAKGALGCVSRHLGGMASVQPVRASALDLPLRTGSVDLVVSNGVIQVTTDPRRAFASLARLLAPGGRIITAHYFRTLWTQALIAFRRPLPLLLPRQALSDMLDRLGVRASQHYFLVDLLYPSAPRRWDATCQEVLAWHREEGLRDMQVSLPSAPGASGLALRLLGWTEITARRAP